jgi:phosphatidylglycerophosphatase A
MSKSLILKITKLIATLGVIGYLPAPGTMGTVAALPLAYAFSFLNLQFQFAGLIVFCCFSYFVINGALKSFTTSDPSQIILDEVVGCLVTFFGISFSFIHFFTGFVLFRLFDIFKPLGIKQVEKLPGAWGVLLDDCVAGLFANLILRLFFL